MKFCSGTAKVLKTDFAQEAFKRVGGCQGSHFKEKAFFKAVKRPLTPFKRVFFHGLTILDGPFSAFKQNPPIALANSALDGAFCLALANDAGMDADGWALIAPFGEHAKTRVYRERGQTKQQRFLQVLDNVAIDALLRPENFAVQMPRATIGLPIYKEHGDLNDVDPAAIGGTAGKQKIGVITKLRKSVRGIEAKFTLDNDGLAAVESGYKFPSAFWYVRAIDNTGDTIRARPFKLISAALTRTPNIDGVESLANSRPLPLVLSNEQARLQYRQAFTAELDATGGNPIQAHRNVMTLPKYSGIAATLKIQPSQ